MSSNDKRDLTTKANDGAVSDGKGKGGGVDITGDVVTLPPDATDVIFTSVCDSSLSGVVDAKLEMSYDKENWCPAVTEEYAAGTSVTGWGNSRYLDTVPGTGVKKNKYCQGKKTYDTSGNPGGSARDVLYDFMQKDKPFNINWWHKSETVPNTVITTPATLGNTKYLDSDGDDWVSISNIWGADDSSDRILGTDKDWTMCAWIRMDSWSYGGFFGFGNYHGHGVNSYFSSDGRVLVNGGSGDYTYFDTASGFSTELADGEWHHVTFAFKSPGTSGTWHFDPLRANSATDPGITIYLDGVRVPWDERTTDSTNSWNGSNADAAADLAVFFNLDFDYTTNSYRGLVCDSASWAIFNEWKSASEVLALKNLGVGTDLSSQSGLKYYVDFQQNTSGVGLSTGALSDGDTTSLANLASTGSTYTTTVQIVSGTNFSIASLATNDDAYIAPDPAVTANNYNPIIFRQGNKDPFSNEKYLNLSKGTGEDKNKYLSAPANITFPGNTKCLKSNSSYGQVKSTLRTSSNIFGTGYFKAENAWSVSFWFRHNNVSASHYGGTQLIFDSEESWDCALWTRSNDSTVRWRIGSLAYNNEPQYGSSTYNLITDGNWHFICLTNSGAGTATSHTVGGATSHHKLYIDGNLQTTTEKTSGTDYALDSYFSFGGTTTGPYTEDFSIDEISFWKRDISSDVSTYYNYGVPKDLSGESNLHANFACGDTSGDSVTASPWIQDTVGSAQLIPYFNWDTGGAGWTNTTSHGEIKTLTSSDSIYNASLNKDIFDSKMGADKPFTINTWFNSSNAPFTTSNTYYQSTKSWTTTASSQGSYYHRAKFLATSAVSSFTNWDIGFDNANGYTISWWIKANSSGTYGRLAGGNNGWSKYQRYWISSGIFKHYWKDGGNVRVEFDMSSYMDGSWRQITFTFLGWSTFNGAGGGTAGAEAAYKLYIDNTEISPDTSATTVGGTPASDDVGYTSNWGVGGDGSSTNNSTSWVGTMDDVTMWNKALSTSERTELYNSGYVVDVSQLSFYSTSDCALWLKMGDGADDALNVGENAHSATNRMQDYSGNGNHFYPYVDTTSGNYNTASLDSSNYAPGKPANYEDDYLPVLFNNGAKTTVPAVTGNTKYFDVVGDNHTSYIEVDGIVSNSIIRNTSDWTVSFWYKGTDTQGDYWTTSDSGCQFYISSGNLKCQVKSSSGGSTSGWFNGASTLTDGDWHMVTVTFKKVASDGDTWYFDPIYSSQAADAAGITLYIDGARQAWTGSATNTTHDFTGGSNKFRWCGREGFNWDTPVGDYDQLAIFSEFKSATQVAAMYDGTAGTAGGKQVDLSTSGSWGAAAISLLNADSDSSLSNGDTLTNDGTGSHTATVTMGTVGHIDVANLGTSETIYKLPVTAYSTFGNGLTASFTKKINTSNNTFDASASQATSLLLSLDGFEDGADAWVNYPAASLLDGNWHNLQITWDGSGTGSKTYGDSTETNNNLKVYIDGEWLAPNAYKGGTTTFTAADKHFKYTTGTFVPGTFGASGWSETGGVDSKYAFQGSLDNLSLHSEVTTLAKAQEFYSKNGSFEGKPHNYQMSNTLTYSNVEGWWTFDETGDSITVANDRTSNNIDLTLNNFDSQGNGLVTMSNSDSIYLVNPLKGEGFTVSMTKNLKDDGTWVDSQDQTARLILSFNGFERDAEHWVAYNTTQTIGSSTINLLDGRWHSVTLSYQGTTAHAGTALSENEIRYGKTQVGGADQPFHFVVSYDGQSLEDITGAGSVSGYNLSKDGETGFVIQNKHLRHENSAAEYVPTTYLASGFIETSTNDSIYAFQGGFDESSFHSDNWWISTTNYNGEKPLTIYGVTFAVAAEYQNRKKPYNLRQPSSAGVTTTTQDQYINPNPYDASTNPGGGMEVYYRWGDTLNDCSESVKDVRGHEGNPKITDRDIDAFFMQHTDTEALATSDSGSGTLYSRDITADGITMYASPASETTEGGLQSNIVQISGCAPNSIKQHIIKGPKLAHMRVKWSGAGSCDLGEDKCRAKLWFRRRKK